MEIVDLTEENVSYALCGRAGGREEKVGGKALLEMGEVCIEESPLPNLARPISFGCGC